MSALARRASVTLTRFDDPFGKMNYPVARQLCTTEEAHMPSQLESKQLPAATGDVARANSGQGNQDAAITRPPTVDPASVHVVSMLTDVQFGIDAAIFLDVSDPFVAAHAMFVKSLAIKASSDPVGGHGDASATT